MHCREAGDLQQAARLRRDRGGRRPPTRSPSIAPPASTGWPSSCGPAEAEAHGLRVRLGDALANAGRGARGGGGLPRGGHAARDAAERSTCAAAPPSSSSSRGHIDEGLALVKHVLASVGISTAETTAARARVAAAAGARVLRARGTRFRRSDAERRCRPGTCSASTPAGRWPWASAWSTPIRGADFQARRLLLALRAGEPYRVARASPWRRSSSRSEARACARASIACSRPRSAPGHRPRERARRRPRAPWRKALPPGSRAAGSTRAASATRRRPSCASAASAPPGRPTTPRCTRCPRCSCSARSRSSRGGCRACSQRAEERGNLLAARYLRVACFSHVAWLAADDPDGARARDRAGRGPQPQRLRLHPALAAGRATGHRALHRRRPGGDGAPPRGLARRRARPRPIPPGRTHPEPLLAGPPPRGPGCGRGEPGAPRAHLDQADRHARELQTPARGLGRRLRPAHPRRHARPRAAGASARWRRSRRRPRGWTPSTWRSSRPRPAAARASCSAARPVARSSRKRTPGWPRSRSAARTAWRACSRPAPGARSDESNLRRLTLPARGR